MVLEMTQSNPDLELLDKTHLQNLRELIQSITNLADNGSISTAERYQEEIFAYLKDVEKLSSQLNEVEKYKTGMIALDNALKCLCNILDTDKDNIADKIIDLKSKLSTTDTPI